MTPVHDNILDQLESIPVEEVPSDELANRLRSRIHTPWDKVKVEQTEFLDPTKPFVPIDWAISIHGIGVFAFDDYNYIQGQAGNGKSFLMSIYEAVIFGAKFGDIKYIGNRPKPKVLHIDTEQSLGNVQLHKVRVYHMAGWEQNSDHRDQYQILMLKETPNPEERWAKIINVCYNFRPDFIFLDGMLDVVPGMNKEEECNQVISEIGTLASMLHICITGICHENPENTKVVSDGPAKPAGHVGSYSQRKGSAGQGIKKKLEGIVPYFDVSRKKVRNKEYDGFRYGIKDVLIRLDGKDYMVGIPYWIDTNTPSDLDGQDVNSKSDGTFNPDDLRNMIDYSIGTESLSFTALREHLKDRYNIGSGKAKVAIDQAVGLGYLVCRDNRYIKLIQTNLLDDPNEEAPI